MKNNFDPKINLIKNIIVFYHEHCLDGFASAYTAWKKFKNKAEYIPLSRVTDAENILKSKKIKINDLLGKEVYFLDFCLEDSEMNKVIKVAKKVIVLDHHISRKDFVKSLAGSVYGENISGAYVSHQYFFPNTKIPTLIKYISIGDTWTWGQEKNEKEVLAYLHTLDFTFKVFQKAERDMETNLKELVNIGKVLTSNFSKILYNKIEEAKLIDFEDYKVYAINFNFPLKSELGHMLAEKTKSFALVYYFLKNVLHVSLRGVGKIDVSQIAKKYDGGGHFNAASFRTKDEKFINEFIKKIIS